MAAPLPLAPVTKLVGVVGPEVSVAPDVELWRRRSSAIREAKAQTQELGRRSLGGSPLQTPRLRGLASCCYGSARWGDQLIPSSSATGLISAIMG